MAAISILCAEKINTAEAASSCWHWDDAWWDAAEEAGRLSLLQQARIVFRAEIPPGKEMLDRKRFGGKRTLWWVL